MTWKVVYTNQAQQDLSDIYEYIAYELLVPDTASRQVHRIMNGIRTLDELPERHQLFDDEPWHSQGLRSFMVDNYRILYFPHKSQNTVNIIRIIYGGRDIKQQLQEIL